MSRTRFSQNSKEREIAIAGFILCMANGGHHSIGEMIITAKELDYFPYIPDPLKDSYMGCINAFEQFVLRL